MEDLPQISRLGIIAGNGPLPFCVLREAEKHGFPTTVAALKEETSPEIDAFAEGLRIDTSVHWMGIGQLGKLLRVFKADQVDKALMVGQVKHFRIFGHGSRNPFSRIKHLPDVRMLRLLSSLPQKDTGSLLGGLIAEIEKEEIEFLDSSVLLGRLLADTGVMTSRSPSEEERRDIRYGLSVAREIARLDIGQTVVVKNQAIVAVEAMEGTDAAIGRAAELAGGERLTVVKVSRPSQDMRFDLPVLGMETLKVAEDCNVTAFAVDQGKTLIIEKELFLRRAGEMGLTVVGLEIDGKD